MTLSGPDLELYSTQRAWGSKNKWCQSNLFVGRRRRHTCNQCYHCVVASVLDACYDESSRSLRFRNRVLKGTESVGAKRQQHIEYTRRWSQLLHTDRATANKESRVSIAVAGSTHHTSLGLRCFASCRPVRGGTRRRATLRSAPSTRLAIEPGQAAAPDQEAPTAKN